MAAASIRYLLLSTSGSPRTGRTLVLVNPTSGGGRAREALPRVAGYLQAQNARADFVETASAEDLERRAAQAAGAGYTHLAVLGGDGAFHYAVNGAHGSDIVLGFFPSGNGNDIALGLGIPTEPVAAAAEFLRVPPRRVDVLRAHCAGGKPRFFVGAGGMGLDAEAARLVHGRFRRLPGVVRYVAAALWVLKNYPPLDVQVTMDGRVWSGAALFAVAANSPCYGAGLKIAPAAEMDDGWMDITVIADMPWTRVVDAILPILRTGDLRWPELQRFRARRARFEAGRAAFFHGDGELLGEAPVELEVLPGAVHIAGAKKK